MKWFSKIINRWLQDAWPTGKWEIHAYGDDYVVWQHPNGAKVHQANLTENLDYHADTVHGV